MCAAIKGANKGTVGRWVASAILLAACVPFILHTIWWWRHNDLAMVSFSVAMPLTAAAACYIKIRRGGFRTTSEPLLLSVGSILAGIVVVGLMFIGWRLDEPILSSFGLWLALTLLLAIWRGMASARVFVIPLMPLIFVATLTRGLMADLEEMLQNSSAAVAEFWLSFASFPVVREGTMLYAPDFWTVVDESCSGVATFTTLMVYTMILAVVVDLNNRRTAVMIVLTGPLALLLNGARIAAITAVGQNGGQVAADEFHDTAGYIVFGVGYGLILATLVLLRWHERRAIAKTMTQTRLATTASKPNK